MTESSLSVPTGLYCTLEHLLRQLLELKGCPEKTPAEIQQARDAIQNSPTAKEELQTSIHDSVVKPDSEKRIKILLALGAPIDELKYGTSTALAHSIQARKFSITRLLLKLGANPNIGISLPLNEAVDRGAEVVKLLLDSGAEINEKALRLAACGAHKEAVQICQILLDAGAPVDRSEPTAGTPLMWAVLSGNADVCALLLERGADVNACDEEEDSEGFSMKSLLHQATVDRSAKCLPLLIKAGAKTDVRNSKGETPRDTALRLGNKKFVKAWDEHVKTA